MQVLVTGATGFIGRPLTAALLERLGPGSVTCLVHSPRNSAEAQAAVAFRNAGIRVLDGDLTKACVCDVPPPPVDVVFHLAANIDTDAPEAEHRVNDQGTVNLLAWLSPVSRGARVVYTSSVAVLDRSGPASGPLDENSPCTPRTSYGRTKLRAEAAIRDAAERDGYTWTIVRLPTVYGPGQKHGGMFDLLIDNARAGGLISRLNWPGRTSVLFVGDAVKILMAVAERPSAANRLYCVSSGEDVTPADIAGGARALLNPRRKPIRLPRIAWRALRRIAWSPVVRALVPRRAFVAYWRLTLVVDDGFWFDARKSLKELALPLVTLDEGLRQTIETIARETIR